LSFKGFDNGMHSRADNERAFAVVRTVIHAWDPYGLINAGAPADEWDDEIARIVAKVPYITSESDATNVISSVFTAAFQPEGFSVKDCAPVGERLYQSLINAGFRQA
jgi:hypothetical protein